ncbi:MAG TPA: GNAT family N-acetyltransferase [Ilumatobacteraceae bacterium]|nr:GNAT family N-acetyltransferase [Ilumatobacteraceae bacterium]
MRTECDLARRIEHSAAKFVTSQAVALAEVAPTSGAQAEALDGGALVSFGPGRYVNRAIGLGFGGTAADEILGALDAFYGERGMPPSLELSPLADPALLTALTMDGYVLERFRNVYAHDLSNLAPAGGQEIVPLTAETADDRKRILSNDAPQGTDARRLSDEFCDASSGFAGTHDFIAVIDGVSAACGSLAVSDGVGWVGGAATLAAHQGKGLQSALIAFRLWLAQEFGCELAAATALPDGQSAQNLVRLGFQLLYTQVVLTKPS